MMSCRKLGDLRIPGGTYRETKTLGSEDFVDLSIMNISLRQYPHHTCNFQMTSIPPDLVGQDFIKVCDSELNRQVKMRCNRSIFPSVCDTKCQPVDDCTSCQVKILMDEIQQRRRPFNQCTPGCELCCRYDNEVVAICDNIIKSNSGMDCNESSMVERLHSTSPFETLVAPNTTPVDTPFPSKREQYLYAKQKMKPTVHYNCRDHGRIFMYTDMTVGLNIIHRPQYAMRGHPIHFKSKRGRGKPKSAKTSYGVKDLGVIYSISEHNTPIQPRHKLLRNIRYAETIQLPNITVQRLERSTYGKRIFTKAGQMPTTDESVKGRSA